jgi:hypothetical protein
VRSRYLPLSSTCVDKLSENLLISMETTGYQLPQMLETYLASLSKLYEVEGDRSMQELVVNARVRLQEEWSYDNYNGGVTGHAVYVTLPEQIFLRIVREKSETSNALKTALNNLNHIQGEFIEEVFLEMDLPEQEDWRLRSGLMLSPVRLVADEAQRRIWSDEKFRLFLSHKSEFRVETGKLKTQLNDLGISAFVAHEDIHPSEEWQEEIENALATMDGFCRVDDSRFPR